MEKSKVEVTHRSPRGRQQSGPHSPLCGAPPFPHAPSYSHLCFKARVHAGKNHFSQPYPRVPHPHHRLPHRRRAHPHRPRRCHCRKPRNLPPHHPLRAPQPPPRASLQHAVFSTLIRPAPHSCTSAGKPELPLYTSAPTGLRNTAQGCRALARLPWVSGIRAGKQTQHIATPQVHQQRLPSAPPHACAKTPSITHRVIEPHSFQSCPH